MEITRYVSENLLGYFKLDKDILFLVSRSLPSPIINNKKNINISIPIKIIIPDKEKNERSNWIFRIRN